MKYTEVLSGGGQINVMVIVYGGAHEAIHRPMLLLITTACSYISRGLPNNVPRVCYRSSPKGWLGAQVWKQLF